MESKLNPNSQTFKANQEGMKAWIAELEKHMESSRFQGKPIHIERARKRGKLLARERIELLLDRDSPFLEICPLSGMFSSSGFGAGGTTICGIGLVAGKLCAISANVGSRKGGSTDEATLKKSMRFNEIVLENRLPSISLVESGGAFLPDQSKIFNKGGSQFRELARRSKEGLGTISVVFGNATAGGAYIPGMSDFTVFIKKRAKVFLAGPPLVRMATGEITDDESLGGAEMHSRISGVSDYLAEDELDGIRIARMLMKRIKTTKPHHIPEGKIKEPIFDSEEILGVIPPDPKTPFDIRELIIRITDGSEFDEFKPEYGSTMVCGWADIHGYPIGILGNNGVIFSESANKACQFIQLCARNDIPLIYLQNTTGFMVGKDYEEGGIIKHGSNLIHAVTSCGLPTISLLVGNSYGAGNYGMNGRAFEPRFLFTYPQSKIAVMGAEQLAGTMEIVQRASAKAQGKEYDEEKGKAFKEGLIKDINRSSSSWYSTSQVWDDGVIDPRETRNYLGFCLAVVYNQEIKGSDSFGVFRM
jgi:acetyl-CoA carboxylase carboxyltransferase component